jgi:hypothetical protein
MDALAPEISNLILDLVALDKPSLLQLSCVSQLYHRRLASRIFRKLVIKSVLRVEGLDTISDKVERLFQFIETSQWTVCVEAIDLGMRLPDVQKGMFVQSALPYLTGIAIYIHRSEAIWA